MIIFPRRIGRIQFLTRCLILFFIYSISFAVFTHQCSIVKLHSEALILNSSFTLIFLTLFGYYLFIRASRFHDLNASGWWALLTLLLVMIAGAHNLNLHFPTWGIAIAIAVAVMNLIADLLLIFKAGNTSSNQYGEPPRSSAKLFSYAIAVLYVPIIFLIHHFILNGAVCRV